MQFTNSNLELIFKVLSRANKYSKENDKGTVNCNIILSKSQHNEVKALLNTIEGLLSTDNEHRSKDINDCIAELILLTKRVSILEAKGQKKAPK